MVDKSAESPMIEPPFVPRSLLVSLSYDREMADDVWSTLLRFHREVFLPDFERILRDVRTGLESRMNAGFERIDGHFDTLERQCAVFEERIKR